jgi:cytochrome P450
MAPPPPTNNKHYLLYASISLVALYYLYTHATLYLQRRSIIRQNGCKPVANHINKDPFFGLDLIRENRKVSREHRLLMTTYGRFQRFGVYTFAARLFTNKVIMTAEPENVKTILSVKFKDFSLGQRKGFVTPLLGHGIFNSDGELWASSRQLLRPSFARENIADLEAFERHFKLLLIAIPKDGSTVDLQDLFFRLTIDSATEFLFDHSTHSLKRVGLEEDDTSEDSIFAKAFNRAQWEIMQNMRVAGLSVLRSQKKFKECNRICHEYVDKFVDEAVAYRERRDQELAGKTEDEKEEKYIFIHELAKKTKDKRRLRDELINILLAGRDTTASLLSNMFFELAKKPQIWAKLREEVGQLNGRLPTYEELRNMKYLKWCLNESLRLHPVVPGNNRLAIRDTVLPLGGGLNGQSPLFIPKDTIVVYHPFTIHRRADLFGPNPHTYNPERWENLRVGWEFIPFNGGPRICLGQQYALTEASYVTARLVQEFAVLESRDQGVWEEQLTFTMCSRGGTRVGMRP